MIFLGYVKCTCSSLRYRHRRAHGGGQVGPNASAGAPRRAVNAGSPVKVGRGPPESEGPPPRVPVRFIGFY